MGELINGRTPEEIKAKAVTCTMLTCSECPYEKEEYFCAANDVMDNLLAYVKHLEAQQPKWISVEEREPAFPCICYDGVNMISIPKNIASLTLKSGEKVFVSDVFLEAFPHALLEKLDDCTHILYWMPLPEPPKVQHD